MDSEKKIAEIREALEDVDLEAYADYAFENVMHKTKARICANAPEWLRFLLDELDKRDECTKENPCRDCLKRSVDGYKEIVRELEDENRKLRQERDKLIEGLRWYAQRNDVNTVSLMLSDKGQRARDILKEIGVTDV